MGTLLYIRRDARLLRPVGTVRAINHQYYSLVRTQEEPCRRRCQFWAGTSRNVVAASFPSFDSCRWLAANRVDLWGIHLGSYAVARVNSTPETTDAETAVSSLTNLRGCATIFYGDPGFAIYRLCWLLCGHVAPAGACRQPR